MMIDKKLRFRDKKKYDDNYMKLNIYLFTM